METTPKNKMVTASPKNKVTKPAKGKGVKENKKDKDKKKDEQEDQPEVLTTKDKQEIQVIEKVLEEKKDAVDVWDSLKRPQIDLIKRTVAKGADDDELKLFLNVCKGTQLNPFIRQVHFVKRWNSKEGREVGTIQVGIDGFRAIAEGGGQYAGSDDAVFNDEAELTLGKQIVQAPGRATVTVYKLMEGERYPFTATARWAEYFPGEKQGYMWQRMPYGQLAKCAESLALRKAFPKLLSGLYTNEEMEQATVTEPKVDNIFEKAKAVVAKMTDVKVLRESLEKVKGSDKYTDEEKKTLETEVEIRIVELEGKENKQDDNTKATS